MCIAVELAEQGIAVLRGRIGELLDEAFDLLTGSVFEGRGHWRNKSENDRLRKGVKCRCNMDTNPHGIAISPKKLEANRRNSQLSTGPKTEMGKKHSRLNAIKHGVLASVLVVRDGNWECPYEFEKLVRDLARDLGPAGQLEEMLVEKIAVCWWRQQRALRYEARMIYECSELSFGQTRRVDQFALPWNDDLSKVIRYEASIQRQLVHAINQLERLQRSRKGEHVPAPVNVQVSSDTLT